jgi:mitogen-activated protein kinase kinase 1 interacting protein 1
MNKMPLVLTFVGSETMNIGHVLAVEDEINGHLDDFKVVVSDPM